MVDSTKSVDESKRVDVTGFTSTDWSQSINFMYLIGLLDRAIVRQLRPRVAEQGLSLPEYTTLAVLLAQPGLSNADLARRALVTPQSMNEVIAKLEKRGYVERHQHPDHGRIRRTEVTERGAEVVVAAIDSINSLQEELLDGIPESEVQLVRGHLVTILRRLGVH